MNFNQTALHFAAERNFTNCAQALIISGCDVKIKDKENSMLFNLFQNH